MRIDAHPILEFIKSRMVRFTFDDQELEGYEGETIAAALHAAGVRVLSHSTEKKRPRGFFCAIGNCSSCMMEVNGVTNVKVCIEPLVEGMVVRTQLGKGRIV